MERSGQEPKQEAKPAVGGIAQRNRADQEYVSNPGSPSGWESPLRGRKDATASAAAAAAALPPPRTPEKREISAAMSPERPSAVLDRRASAATNSGGTIV